MIIRSENPCDASTISDVVTVAFKAALHSCGTEADIITALRESGALSVSLVAVDDGAIVGHIAFSPVTIAGKDIGWSGLGPVAVTTDKQRAGIGAALINAGLERIKSLGARGCVVLGDPSYYGRFGFKSDANLRFGDVPVEYFQHKSFDGSSPVGNVEYHAAFYIE